MRQVAAAFVAALTLVLSPVLAHASMIPYIATDLGGTGSGAPDSQSFEFYTLDLHSTPVVFETGPTPSLATDVTPVPEPATLLLFGTGLALALKLRRRLDRSAS